MVSFGYIEFRCPSGLGLSDTRLLSVIEGSIKSQRSCWDLTYEMHSYVMDSSNFRFTAACYEND
jgi:hypothetical protein